MSQGNDQIRSGSKLNSDNPGYLTTNDGLQPVVPPGAVGNRTAPVSMSVALGTVKAQDIEQALKAVQRIGR